MKQPYATQVKNPPSRPKASEKFQEAMQAAGQIAMLPVDIARFIVVANIVGPFPGPWVAGIAALTVGALNPKAGAKVWDNYEHLVQRLVKPYERKA